MSKKKLKKCIPDLDWKVDEIINIDGSIGNKYYYKGKRASKVILEGKIAEEMAGYTLIYHDVNMILKWLNFVINEHKKIGIDKTKQSRLKNTPENLRDNFDLIKAFMIAAFTFYCKIFTKAPGRKIKLQKSIFKEDNEFLRIHDELMVFRHNLSAHSGNQKIESVQVSLILDSLKERNTRPLIVRTMDQPNAFTNKFLQDFVKICEFISDFVDKKIHQLNDEFYKNLTPDKVEIFYNISKV